VEVHNIPTFNPTRSPCSVRLKIIAQAIYGVHLLCSTYVQKCKKISFPIPLVPRYYLVWVNRNHQNKWTSRIYHVLHHQFLDRWTVYCVGVHWGLVWGFVAVPKPLYSVAVTHVRIGFLLGLNLSWIVRCHRFVKLQLREVNHSSAIFVTFFLVLTCILRFTGKN
jgi:hypothetical protein